MNDITPAKVRSFRLTKYAEAIDMLGFKADEVPDTFDFLLNGVIDRSGYSR
jgi:hypothetical protein